MYRIQVRQDHVNGAWYWRIVGGNGAVVLTSETYATKSNALRAARRFYEETVWSTERTIRLRLETE